MPPVPLEARVYQVRTLTLTLTLSLTPTLTLTLTRTLYQVLIPLSAIYLAATLIPGSPFNNGGAPSA